MTAGNVFISAQLVPTGFWVLAYRIVNRFVQTKFAWDRPSSSRQKKKPNSTGGTFLRSNIPSSPAYGVFISQLIRYARACSSYECFILRAMRLSNKLLGQGYVKERLKSSLRKFYGRYGDVTKQYEVPLSRMLHDILYDDHIQWHPPLIGHYTNFWPLLIWTLLPNLTFYLIVQGFHRTYATGAACQQRTLTPPDTWSCPTLGLACVLMSRPISPELVLSPDFWISNTPRYFSFASFRSHQDGWHFLLQTRFV